ncbi:MAG TPA: ABC transporter permease [Actinomycetota bacterium]|nr:ABC transporter permease [Actinomycetota bacterium]
MNAVAVAPPSNVAQRIRLALSDGLVVAWRNLVTIWRVPTVLVFELVQPIMFVLLFRYVYENAIRNIGFDYVLFLMPGIFIQNAIFGSTSTAIGLAEDLKKGLLDRFRSLPMARSAVLAGRTTSDLAKNLILVLVMIAIGYLVGFRFQNGFVPALGVVVLVLAVSFTFSWISATVGLAIKQVEGVQAAVFTFVFPLVFVSAAFIPVESMSSVLQPIARNNPITFWCDLARHLSLGSEFVAAATPASQPVTSVDDLVIKSALWIVGLLAVFIPLSIRLYRKLT